MSTKHWEWTCETGGNQWEGMDTNRLSPLPTSQAYGAGMKGEHMSVLLPRQDGWTTSFWILLPYSPRLVHPRGRNRKKNEIR